MEKRFSLFLIVVIVFALALVFGVPNGAKAGADMNQKGAHPGSSHDGDTAAQDSVKPDTSMGRHAGMMDKKSMAGKDHLEGLTDEQHKEYSLMPKAHREIISKLHENQRREFFSLSREERDRFLSYNPGEREVFLTLNPDERTAFMTFTVREREMFVGFHPNEREVFLSLSPLNRQTWISLIPRERNLLLTLKPEERTWFFSLDRQERNKFFAAGPEERHRMLSRAATTGRDAEKGEMSSKDTNMPSKDTDHPRNMKSGENTTDHSWYWRDERKGHDKTLSDKDMGKSSDMDMGKSSDMDTNQWNKEHQRNWNKSDKDSNGYSAPTNKGSEM